MRVACVYLDSSSDAQSIAEIFYRATPQIRLRGNQAIFLEISKCKHLYSEETFLKRAHVTLKRIGASARLSVADDIPTALSLAIHRVSDKALLPIECLAYYCDPLGQNSEQSVYLVKSFSLLKSLRIHYIQDFMRIPSYEISPRFGPLLLMAYQRWQGEHPIPWTPFQPREVVEEKHEFDLAYPPRDLEPVYFILRPILEKLFLRLRSRGRRMRQFQVLLQQEYPSLKSPQSYTIDIIIQLPFVSAKTIFQITKEKLEAQIQRTPLEHAVTCLTVTVTEEAPYMTSQKDLFDQKKEETSESFYHLVSRLATKLGQNSTFYAHTKDNYLPERNWLRVPEKCTDITQDSAVPERPLRLFKEPIPASIQNSRLICSKKTYEIVEWKNAEVILSNWWEISDNERVYYRLNTTSGESFWVYRHRQNYFVHGMFE